MLFKLNTHSKIGLLIFLGMIGACFLVPTDFFEYSYYWFSLVVIVPIIILGFMLRYLHKNNNMEYNYVRYDVLVFDLLYMLALPILYTVLMARTGRPLWHLPYIGEIYYIGLGIITILKLVSVSNRHAGIARFSIIVGFPLINLIVINQVYSVWYIWTYWSLGYK